LVFNALHFYIIDFMKKAGIIIALIFIPILAILPLFNSGYFNMHDVQHPVRLFLLNKGISQGYLYPRWVDDLGFGFGYPLFNFYPPLIYYVAIVFVLLGFSLVCSLKIMLGVGFVLGAFSSYLYARLFFSRRLSLLVATFFTYTFYHAITVYVRGAFAEFFSYSLFPLVAYFLQSLINKPSLGKILGLGLSFALLLLCHPLIAFPSVFFIGAYLLLAWVFAKKKVRVILSQIFGLVLGLGLSAFFWLPSFFEKKDSLVEEILTKELFNYRLHFVQLKQFYYSPWGFGGSTAGTADGISFQIGKYYLLFLALSFLGGAFLLFKKTSNKIKKTLMLVGFNLCLLGFSWFMTLPYSQFIWDKINYLWYLQFPWRFFTFASLYLSIVSVSVFVWWGALVKNRLWHKLGQIFLIAIAFVLVIKYSLLFKPQTTFETTDKKLTNLKQRQWVISKTSFEFVPKGVATKKNELGVTTLAINSEDLPKESYRIIKGKALVKTKLNHFRNKKYLLNVIKPAIFQLNTYHYPGWSAFLNGQQVIISDKNRFKLIRVVLPKGTHNLVFKFQNTYVRSVANVISYVSFGFLLFCKAVIWMKKQQKRFWG